MFASQLLRILQTISSDVKSETGDSVYDSAELGKTMKENKIESLHSSIRLGREADLLTFGSKELYHFNGLKRDKTPSLFEVQGTGQEFQNGLLYLSNLEEDAYFLSSEPNAKGKEQSGHECSMAGEEFARCNENESKTVIHTESDPEGLLQEGQTCFEATSKTVINALEESFIDRTLPIQEFGTRSFLRSFLNSMDGEENKVKQLPDQISSGELASEGSVASSAVAGPMEDVQSSSLYYNSKVETGSITFNFNSQAPEAGGDTNGGTKNDKQPYVDSRDVLGHESGVSNNLSDSRQVHCKSSKDTSTEKIHEQSLDIRDGFPNDYYSSNQAHCVSQGMSNENANDQYLDHKCVNPADLSSRGLPQFVNGQAVESHILKHELGDPDKDSVVNLRKYDEGESSFFADSLITYSGQIAYSGSLSLCSDGSATSDRSFAFPVLQQEWNSSPVRMTKADGRYFRKHKGWRSGLLCCRF